MMKWINKKRNKKGFTLVELVVVIAILGILAAIAVPKFSNSRANAAKVAHNANVRILESAANLAVIEGITGVTWNERTKISGGKGWGNYIEDWPTVPKGIGKDDEKYTVEIASDAAITVEPVKINLE